MSKVTGCRFTCDTKTVGVSRIVSTMYRRPCHLAVIMMSPLADLTRASCSSNSTLMLLSASLDTEIKLDLSSGVYNEFSKVIFLSVPLTTVLILAFPFPKTLKVESLLAAKPMVGWCSEVSDTNDPLLTKQWSDAPESISVGTSSLIFGSLLHVG